MDKVPAPLDAQPVAQCMETLFGIKLAKYPELKNAINSMIRNGLIESVKTPPEGGKDSRGKVFIPKDQLTVLYNATLLHGVFSNAGQVKKIFTEEAVRVEVSQWLSELLIHRHSVVGVGLYPREVSDFINTLTGNADLRTHRLPNPFVELPQLSLGSFTSVMQGLLAQAASLSPGDSMMSAFLEGELEQAWKQAKKLQTDNSLLLKYQALIVSAYEEADDFDKTLDSFR